MKLHIKNTTDQHRVLYVPSYDNFIGTFFTQHVDVAAQSTITRDIHQHHFDALVEQRARYGDDGLILTVEDE